MTHDFDISQAECDGWCVSRSTDSTRPMCSLNTSAGQGQRGCRSSCCHHEDLLAPADVQFTRHATVPTNVVLAAASRVCSRLQSQLSCAHGHPPHTPFRRPHATSLLLALVGQQQ
jgi:hypothetical protein